MTQPVCNNIEAITIRTKTSPIITIGAVYAPPKAKLTPEDLDKITTQSASKYYLIGGDFNAKHPQWNNINRNSNGVTLEKHAESENYQVIHSNTYTFQQPGCKPSNLDIFLSNIPYIHTIRTIDDLALNHLPVILKFTTHRHNGRNGPVQHTDWNKYRKICSSARLCTEIRNTQEIDSQIEQLQKNIQQAFQRATHQQTGQNSIGNRDTYLLDLIKNRNRHRRKYQKTGNLQHKLVRNILTTKIRARIAENRNRAWQDKLQQIGKADHTLWSTYKTLGTINSRTPVLTDPRTNQSYHTDEEKAEAIARTFEAVHNRAYETISPLEDQLPPATNETIKAQRGEQQIPISPAFVSNLIKKLPKRKAPGLDKITPEKLRNLPRKSIVQIYYIFKASIHHAYFPEVWKIAKVHPVPKPGKPKNNINNYRPISLLSTLSKILEKIIHSAH